jgi:hypothetical protein
MRTAVIFKYIFRIAYTFSSIAQVHFESVFKCFNKYFFFLIAFQIKKAVSIRKHLERNRKDRDAKFRLILIESRIHRLARYYKTRAVLPPNWKYESSTASALVS